MFIEWREEMSVGNSIIDNQHKQLIRIINNLGEAMQRGEAAGMINQIIEDLVSYTVMHFSNEERIFGASQYPHVDRHKQKHVFLVDKVKNLQTDIAQGRAVMSVSVMNFLRDWLTEHIMKTDKTYVPFI